MGGQRRLAGVRIVSTDTGWSLGDGDEIRGADVDLLLAVAGRRVGLAGLVGEGVETLTRRLD